MTPPIYPIPQSILCNGDSLASTVVHQTYSFSTNHQFQLSRDALGRDNLFYQYVLFTPPLTDEYYIRVPYTSFRAVLEIRTGGCNVNYSSIVGTNEFQYSTEVGFDSQLLENGVEYVILFGSFYYGTNLGNILGDGTILEVGSSSASNKLGLGIGIPLLFLFFCLCCFICKSRKRSVPKTRNVVKNTIPIKQPSVTHVQDISKLVELITLFHQLGIDFELCQQYAKGLAKNGCTSPASLLLVENEADLEICGITKRFHILSIMNWINENKNVKESIPVARVEESIPVAKVMEA
jgi:hypothetical protein